MSDFQGYYDRGMKSENHTQISDDPLTGWKEQDRFLFCQAQRLGAALTSLTIAADYLDRGTSSAEVSKYLREQALKLGTENDNG